MHLKHIFHSRRFARRAEGWDHDEHGRRHDHGRGEHGRHRRHGSGRLFDYGELRLVLLALIAERPRHGYELIKAIEDRAGGGYSPSPGVIYPTLTQLEDIGHATIEAAEGGRKLYAITEAGRAYLAGQAPAVAAAFARLDESKADRAGDRAPQIVRAMENLKLALRLRFDRGPVSAADIDAIAAALDAAASGVEKT
jgi:DNA-binding PadR family transcriptional regulator